MISRMDGKQSRIPKLYFSPGDIYHYGHEQQSPGEAGTWEGGQGQSQRTVAHFRSEPFFLFPMLFTYCLLTTEDSLVETA